MPEVVNGNNILLGRGKIYFDRFDATGARTGELFLGNCPTFEITPTSEDIKKYSSADKAADLIASDVLRTTLALRIVGDEFSKENLAMALFGDTATLAQTGPRSRPRRSPASSRAATTPLSKRQVSAGHRDRLRRHPDLRRRRRLQGRCGHRPHLHRRGRRHHRRHRHRGGLHLRHDRAAHGARHEPDLGEGVPAVHRRPRARTQVRVRDLAGFGPRRRRHRVHLRRVLELHADRRHRVRRRRTTRTSRTTG